MALPIERRPVTRGATPAILMVVIGVWLFISAFAWPHSTAQMNNTWIMGILCVVFALVSMAVPWVRYLNTVLAVWLFISAWALPMESVGTVWNNVLCAIAIFVLSLLAGGAVVRPHLGQRHVPPTPA
jgi:hypothetical protein